MASTNIRDILTAFSPALDYLAISTGDGRIKIWDTVKGQVQTEFADITSAEETGIYAKAEKGHLSVDYTCMKWLSLDKKKKRKLGTSLLVLGTGGGDVLALDVAAGQLKWRISDCHPGGVSSVAFSTNASCIYIGGADGMISEIDPHGGNLLRKFKASTKAISCLSVSSDGKTLATASAQIKTFGCSDLKKIQKFTGHPGALRCITFTEDGKYILSSAVGERYVAIWKTDGGKKQSASCVLAMEHPAVFVDSRCTNNGEVDQKGLYVLAISEVGCCYLWYGQNIEELRSAKATKVSLSVPETQKGVSPTIFAAKLQGVVKPGFVHAFIVSGMLVKPAFQKMLLQSGTDLTLNTSQDGILLSTTNSFSKSKKGRESQNKVTALDRAYAEDALLPVPRVADMVAEKDRPQDLSSEMKDQAVEMDTDDNTFCMEDKLRSLGIIGTNELIPSNLSTSTVIKGVDLEAYMPQKKIRSAVLSMEPNDAYETLKTLVALWQTRAYSGKHLLPWIYNILVNHSHHIMSQEEKNHQMLNTLLKMTKSRGMAAQQLLQLSGRLQLITAQIDKGAQNRMQGPAHDDLEVDESEEEEDEDVEEHLYGDENSESELSSDDDN